MTTWVLLRGLMREARHWGEFPMQFQNAMGAQHVVTLDFPGNGRLHAQTSATSVAEMAKLLPHTTQATGLCATLPCAGPVIGGDGSGGME